MYDVASPSRQSARAPAETSARVRARDLQAGLEVFAVDGIGRVDVGERRGRRSQDGDRLSRGELAAMPLPQIERRQPFAPRVVAPALDVKHVRETSARFAFTDGIG